MIHKKLIVGEPFVDRTEGAIVTSGLQLHLDAKNPLSYSGTGTQWKDLSGNNKHATLKGGVTFDGTNAFDFDGSDDIAEVGDLGVYIPTFTITIWANLQNSAQNFDNLIDTNFDVVHHNTGPRLATDMNGALYWFMSSNTTDSSVWDLLQSKGNNPLNVWLSASMTRTSGGLLSMYINGVANVANRAETSGVTGYMRNIHVGDGFKGTYGISRHFKGKISKVMIYNKALSSKEILDNYNAIKPRFL